MDTAQLSALFAAHKTAILGTAAAGVAGLALYQKRKGAGAAGSTAVGAAVPGTLPAAAVEPQSLGAYDSTSFDLYNALQPELEQILQTGTSGGGVAAPPPVASTLFAPSGSGKYVGYGNGLYEVEPDGSLYHLSPGEWASIIKANGGRKPAGTQLSGPAPGQQYGGTGNLQTWLNKANPAKASS